MVLNLFNSVNLIPLKNELNSLMSSLSFSMTNKCVVASFLNITYYIILGS